MIMIEKYRAEFDQINKDFDCVKRRKKAATCKCLFRDRNWGLKER